MAEPCCSRGGVCGLGDCRRRAVVLARDGRCRVFAGRARRLRAQVVTLLSHAAATPPWPRTGLCFPLGCGAPRGTDTVGDTALRGPASLPRMATVQCTASTGRPTVRVGRRRSGTAECGGRADGRAAASSGHNQSVTCKWCVCVRGRERRERDRTDWRDDGIARPGHLAGTWPDTVQLRVRESR